MFTTRRVSDDRAGLDSPVYRLRNAPTDESNILHVQPGCGVQSFQDKQRRESCDGRCDVQLPSGPRFPFERTRTESALRKQVQIAAQVAPHPSPASKRTCYIWDIQKAGGSYQDEATQTRLDYPARVMGVFTHEMKKAVRTRTSVTNASACRMRTIG
jgi:hypothetical protein